MDSLFQAAHQAQASARLAADLESRAIAPYLAIVTNNDDPQGQRRLRASDPVMPGLETYWLRRLVVAPRLDSPVPDVGSTVLVLSVDGDPVNGWWMECMNDTNPPLKKSDPLQDLHSDVRGEQVERVGKDLSISVGESLTLRNDAGASITLAASGNVIIEDSSGNKMTLAGGITFSTGSLQVGGKQIATVGAPDTRNDILTDRGW